MQRRIWAALGLGLAAVAACGEIDSYVYSARRYDADGNCLDPYVSIDLVNGTGASSTCAATCFRFHDEVYTTRVCPPLPDGVDELDPASPECTAANDPAIYDASCLTAVLDAGPDGD